MCRQLELLLKLAPYHGWSRRIALPGLGATAYARSLSCYAQPGPPAARALPFRPDHAVHGRSSSRASGATKTAAWAAQLAASPKAENDLEWWTQKFSGPWNICFVCRYLCSACNIYFFWESSGRVSLRLVLKVWRSVNTKSFEFQTKKQYTLDW